MKELIEKMKYLDELIKKGKYPRGISFLGPGSGNFYQCVNASRWALMKMEKRTKKNRRNWDLHSQRIEILHKIAMGYSQKSEKKY